MRKPNHYFACSVSLVVLVGIYRIELFYRLFGDFCFDVYRNLGKVKMFVYNYIMN